MCPLPLTPESVLKRSPFLVARQINDNEVRVYSKLHGNLQCFGPEVTGALRVFDAPVKVEDAARRISGIYPDPMAVINELYERHFLVGQEMNERDIFTEYVDKARRSNEVPNITKVTFLISARCNLACRGCYHTFYDFKSKDMDVGFADRVFEGLFPQLELKGIPRLLISFLGYEPLVNFEAMRGICDHARTMGERHNIETSFKVFTNGFSLSGKTLDWVIENKSRLGFKVSLDGIKGDNDKRRIDRSGTGTYDRVAANIKRILSTGVECGVLTVLSKLNFANIEKFVDEMAAIGIKRITANIFCGQSDDERTLELTEDEKFEAVRRMDQATESRGMEFDGEFKFAVLQMITGAHFTCPAGMKQIVFCADEVIHPCQRFAGTEINFGKYGPDFWDKLLSGRCGPYNDWNESLYDGIMKRIGEQDTDLTGWSCPFLPFIRGQCLNSNLERRFHEKLLDYYITRPLDRIVAESRIQR